MPEPNRVPWVIQQDLNGWCIWQLVEMNVTIRIHCDACQRETVWGPTELNRRLGRFRGKPLWYAARQLRCSDCRSEWVRISAEPGSMLGKRPEIWS